MRVKNFKESVSGYPHNISGFAPGDLPDPQSENQRKTQMLLAGRGGK